MRAYGNEAPRLFDPRGGATRWTWRKRRIRSRLRSFGFAVVAGMTGIWAGLLRALHDSRSRSAARIIRQYRHLLQDDHRAGDAGRQTRQSDLAER